MIFTLVCFCSSIEPVFSGEVGCCNLTERSILFPFPFLVLSGNFLGLLL